GTTPSQAQPSKMSSSNAAGMRGRSTSGRTGQCMNNRSCQHMAMTQGRCGKGHGRWVVSEIIGGMVLSATEGMTDRIEPCNNIFYGRGPAASSWRNGPWAYTSRRRIGDGKLAPGSCYLDGAHIGDDADSGSVGGCHWSDQNLVW